MLREIDQMALNEARGFQPDDDALRGVINFDFKKKKKKRERVHNPDSGVLMHVGEAIFYQHLRLIEFSGDEVLLSARVRGGIGEWPIFLMMHFA